MIRAAIAILWLSLVSAAPLARAAPALADYVKDPATAMVHLSPSGDQYAYLAMDGATRRLIVARTADNHASAIDIGSAYVTGLSWAGDDHLLISTAAVGKLGPGFTQTKAWMTSVFVYNLKTRGMFRVFAGKDDEVGGIVEGSYGVRLIGGHWYGFFGGFNEERQPATLGAATRRDLYQVDLDTGSIKLVSHGSDQGDSWLVGPTGQVVARYQYEWATGGWRVLAGPEGGEVLASGHSKFGGGGELTLGRTPAELLFARPADAEGPVTYETLPLTGAPAALVADSETINCVVVDGKSGLWIGTTRSGDKPEVQFFTPALELQVRKIFDAFPDRMPRLISWNDAFTWMIVFTSGAGDSGTYYLVDLTTNRAQPIGYAHPTIEPKDVRSVRVVDYAAGDGLALHGVLSLPPGADGKGLALVVLPHGGMGARDYPDFDQFAQALASRGYAVFQPNSRGSSGYGADFLNAGYGQLGGKIQTDISDGVAMLAREDVIDPKRVCIVGNGGWGGYAALAGVTLQQGLYRCAVAIKGVADLAGAINESEKPTAGSNNETRYLRDLVGAKSAFNSDVAAISPVRLADHADAPILLLYTRNDVGMSTAQSEEMAAALGRAAKPVEVAGIVGNGDDATMEASRISMLQAVVAFVEKYDPPGAAPAAVAESQPGR